MMKLLKYTLVVILAAVTAVAVFLVSNSKLSARELAQKTPVTQDTTPNSSPSLSSDFTGQVAGGLSATTNVRLTIKPLLSMPISQGLSRITKKHFGLFVTPENSPVEDDIFNGFHTGVDFEINNNEQNTAITVSAACDGDVLLKTWASGYGGVLVQSCNINGEDVTVIYGHLDLESINSNVGQKLTAGDMIGNLGHGYSHDTDGRRKHLHFDIHKGTELNILGYVPNQDDLANWIDPMKYLQ